MPKRCPEGEESFKLEPYAGVVTVGKPESLRLFDKPIAPDDPIFEKRTFDGRPAFEALIDDRPPPEGKVN